MSSRYSRSARRTRFIAALAAGSLALAACGSDDEPAETTEVTSEPAPEAAPEPTTEASQASSTATSTSATETETSTETSTTSAGAAAGKGTSTSKSSPTSSAVDAQEQETLDEVRERFAVLAPPEFFAKLDGCSQADMEGYFDCAGSEVGQFQFFDSESKAASTTQVLTELRSSKIVEDNGNRVVGWSTVGTSAIVTVVDNSAGQVMQHLISTDREDPRRMIYDLGLAKEN